jgi:PIN domain nuclease of toxin-antitoxin system
VKLLLDTHIWLWWMLEPKKLPAQARDLIADRKNHISFSAASIWEIAIKYRLGKLKLPMPPGTYVPARLAAQHFEVLPINAVHASEVALLPDYHQDPFDRLLVVQAQLEGMTLLTADQELKPYMVNKIIVSDKRRRS